MSRSRSWLALLAALAVAAWIVVRGSGNEPRGGAEGAPAPERAEAAELGSAVLVAPAAESAAPGSRVEAARATEATPDAPAQGEARLLVRVVAREDGAPLAGIPVALRTARGDARASQPARPRGTVGEILRTDRDGRVEFAAPAELALTLQTNPLREPGAERISEPVAELDAGERREVVLELAPHGALVWFGRIVDGETGAGLGGAEVRHVADPLQAASEAATATCDASGLVRLGFSSWEDAYACASYPGYAAGIAHLDEEHGEPSASFTLLLHRAATLEVNARSAGGAPVAGLQLELACSPYELVQGSFPAALRKRFTWRSTTDESGRARLEGLPPNVALSVEMRDGERLLRSEERSLWFAPGEVRVSNWNVGVGCLVEGRTLEADGRAAPDVPVWLKVGGGNPYLDGWDEGVVARTHSDASGRFTFADVAAGSWLVGPARDKRGRVKEPDAARAIAPLATVLDVLPEQERASVVLTCWRGLYVRGSVLDPDGKPVNVIVTAIGDGFRAHDEARGGRFTLGPLPPGSYEIHAITLSAPFALPEPVTAVAGTDDLVLQLGRGAGVTVTVFDSRGHASQDAMVTAVAENGPGSFRGTTTGADGRAVFGGLVPGTYTLTAATIAGEFAMARSVRLAAESDGEPVELRLEPAARLRISVLHEPWKDADVRVLVDGLPIGVGFLAGDPLSVVPPGEIEIELFHWGRDGPPLARRRVRTLVGQETAVTFEIEPPK